MKKFFITIITTIAFLVLYTSHASAVTLSPASGSFPVSGNKTITILSNSPNRTTALSLRLVIDNAKVVSFTRPDGALIAIGVCDSNGTFFRSVSATKYEVCADIASTSGAIANGTSLGTITLAPINSSGGAFTVTAGAQNGYLVGTNTEPATGVLGSYSFGSVPVLPNTALSDYMPNRGILGAAILISGIISLAVAIKIFLLDKRRELL